MQEKSDDSTPSGSGSESPKTVKPEQADTKLENKGHLIVNATAAPSDIKYPADLDLLNDDREKSETLIELLFVLRKGKSNHAPTEILPERIRAH